MGVDDAPHTKRGTASRPHKLPSQVTRPPKEVFRPPRSKPEPVLIVMTGVDIGRVHILPTDRTVHKLGRADENDVQLLDEETSRFHAELDLGQRWVLRDLDSANGSYVNGIAAKREQPIALGDTLRLGSQGSLRLVDSLSPEAAFAREMYAAALRDSLTGVFNRRYLDDHLERELAFAKRHRYPLALLMADIDHFKRVNDQYGHRAGDAALRYVADALLAGCRTEDVVARYGGEEFAVVCRNTDEPNATILAERLRDAVGRQVFDFEGQLIRLTISIGVAGSFENGAMHWTQLVDAADEALYLAKSEGRNCWRAASTRPPTSSGQNFSTASG